MSHPCSNDFWSVSVQCSQKTPLKQAGFVQQQIVSEKAGWKSYGRRSYQQWTYRVQVATVEMTSGQQRIDEVEAEMRAKFEPMGLAVRVRYHAMD